MSESIEELNNNCGVYIIISPSNGRYVGSSINLKKRFNRYKNYSCSGQSAILSSLKKYGYNNHKIKVLFYCHQKEILFWERIFGDIYRSLVDYPNGLNIILPNYGDVPQVRSIEFRKRVSEMQIKRFSNNNERVKTSIATKAGFTKEVREKLSKVHKERFLNKSLRERRSIDRNNFYINNPEAKILASIKAKEYFKKNPEKKQFAIDTLAKYNSNKTKKIIATKIASYKIINSDTQEKFETFIEVANILKVPKQTFRNWVYGVSINPTKYVLWKQ